MIPDWKVCTETMTDGEVVEYFVDGDEIVIASNLAKNEIRLSHSQAVNMTAGLCHQMSLLIRATDASS